MNIGVSSALNNSILDFQSTTFQQLAIIIPFAMAVLITIVVVFWGIAQFKKLSGLDDGELHVGTDIHHLSEYIQEHDPELWEEMEENYEHKDD